MDRHDQDVPRTPSLLRRRQVERRTGLSRSTLYLRMSQGSFPKPVHLGVRSVAWLEADVSAWIEKRVAESRRAQN